MPDSMLGRFFALNVKPEHRQAFLEASLFAAQSTLSEEHGVFQYQIMEDVTDPNRFYVYDVFRDEAALQEHLGTAAVKTWWSEIRPMLDGDMEPIARMRSIFPTAQGFKAQKPGLLQW